MARSLLGPKKTRCDGSDMPYAAHGKTVELAEVKPCAFHKTLARLSGHSVTWVDFLGARMFTAELRAHGLVRPREVAIKFVLQQTRDVPALGGDHV